MSSNLIQCIICRLHFEPGNNFAALKCGHTYHFDCIEEWINKQKTSPKTCPICRREVTSPLRRLFINGSDEPDDENENSLMEQMRPKFESARKMPISRQIEIGLHLNMIEALSMPDNSVQLEAISIIGRYFSGTPEQIWAIFQAKGLEKLMEFCKTKQQEKLGQQAFSAIAHIPLKRASVRKMLFAEGIIQLLVDLSNRIDKMNQKFVRSIILFIYNFTLECPFHEVERLAQLIAPLSILIKYNDLESRNCACWALFHLIESSKSNTKLAHQLGFLPAIIGLLKFGREELVYAALCVLEKFAVHDDESAQSLFDTGFFDSNIIHQLLGANDEFLKRKCYQILYGIFARGNQRQIQAIIDAKLMHFIFDILAMGMEIDCLNAMENFVKNCGPEQLLAICRTENSIVAICKNLDGKNENEKKKSGKIGDDGINKLLDILYAILYAVFIHDSENFEAICERVKSCGGLEKLKKLQQNESKIIRKGAEKIINKFF